MAGNNQPPRYANSSPVPGANGRGGHQTGSRGHGKRGNGRYYNNNNHNHNRGSQPNGTYGPHPISEMSAPTNFLQDHPVPWGLQFGGYPMPMPRVGDTGPWTPPAPGLDYPNNATAMMQSRAPSAYTDAPSHVDTNSPNIPVYAPPIATSMAHTTAAGADIKASPAPPEAHVAVNPSKKILNATSVATLDISEQAVSRSTGNTNGGAQPATVDLTVRTTSKSDSLQSESRSPERRTFAVDANHSTLDQVADQLDVEKIISLQVYNISLASKLRQTLQEAKSEHQARENKIDSMQVNVIKKRSKAIDEESKAVEKSSALRDHFYKDMVEACKLEGDEKPVAQLRATEHLKSLTEFTNAALKQRNLIDNFQIELLDIEKARARSRTKYSNTIFDVLMKALGAEAPKPFATSRKEDTATSAISVKTLTVAKVEAATVDHVSTPKEDRQDSAAVTMTADSKESTHQPDQSKEQPVFERRPEPEHRSIREALEAVNTVDKPFEDSASVEKQKAESKKSKEKQLATPDVKASTFSFTTKDTLAPKPAKPAASATSEPRDKAIEQMSSLAPNADSDKDPAHLSSTSTPQTRDQHPRPKNKKQKKKKASAAGGTVVGMTNAAPKTGPAKNGGTTHGAAKAGPFGGRVGSSGASNAGPAAGEMRKGG